MTDSTTQAVPDLKTKVEELTEQLDRLRKELEQARKTPRRERLPDTRDGITHKFSISGHEGYFIVGFYPDGRPAELFIKMAKEGSTIGGLMDTVGILTSLALQYGVPLESLVRKFPHSRFEPSGHTTNPDIGVASSIPDYIFHWLDREFGSGAKQEGLAEASLPAVEPESPNP